MGESSKEKEGGMKEGIWGETVGGHFRVSMETK